MIKIVILRPGEPPVAALIENTLGAMQEIVGGYIESVRDILPLRERGLHLYVNEEGKLRGLPRNIYLDGGDIVLGTAIVSKVNAEGNDVSLTEREIAFVVELFTERARLHPVARILELAKPPTE